MNRRRLVLFVVVGLCALGSSVVAVTSVRTGSMRVESTLSTTTRRIAPLSTIHGTAGTRLSLAAVPAVDQPVDFDPGDQRPTAASSADFDEDGTPDLVAAYGSGDTGTIVLWRGNVDAQFPNAPEAQARREAGTFTDAAFLGVLATVSIDHQPEFIAASDFDGDGHVDVALTHTGATTISLLSGSGAGTLAAERSIDVLGSVTAYACGNVGLPDTHDDIVVSLSTPAGPQLAVLRAGSATFGESPERIAIPALVTALAIGRVGDDAPTDIVGVSGSTVWMINGLIPNARDKRSFDGRVIQRELPFVADDVLIGNFAGSKRRDIALLDRSGGVRVLAQRGERDFDVPASDVPRLATLELDSQWRLLDAFQAEVSPNDARSVFVATRMSGRDLDDLVLSDGEAALSVVINGVDTAAQKREPAFEAVVERITTVVDVAAVLPLRLNGDAIPDLVTLGVGASSPSTIVSAPRQTFLVTTIFNAGVGSLRQAITDANMMAGFDQIQFAIPGGGPHVINLNTELPSITEACSIDATTQPGFAGNPIVGIDAAGAGGGVNGFTIVSGSTSIRGFSITDFGGTVLTGNGIFFPMASGDGNTIQGNFIGVDTGGTVADPNGSDGIRGEAGSDNHQIGGTVAAARNVSTANSDGVQFSNTFGAIIQGNYLGPNATGTAGPGNMASGCRLSGTTGCTVGGSVAGARNVCSANAQEGIVANTGATGNVIAGNHVGVNAPGSGVLSNGTIGVNLSGANATTVGGPTGASRNVISANPGGGISAPASSQSIEGNYIGLDAAGIMNFGNGANGVTVGGANVQVFANKIVGHPTVGLSVSGTGNTVSANEIFANQTALAVSGGGFLIESNFIGQNNVGVVLSATGTCTDNIFVQDNLPLLVTGAVNCHLRRNQFVACGSLCIDLNADGPTPNDVGDGDAGPNGLQNFPVIASAVSVPGGTVVMGNLNSAAFMNFEIDFHSNSACSAGDAQTYLGSTFVMSDGSGNAPFTFNGPSVAAGSVIVCTATITSVANPATSEFSACATVTASADLSIAVTDMPDPVAAGSTLTLQATVTNAGPSTATMGSMSQGVPAGSTFASFSAAPGWNCVTPPVGGSGTVTCTSPSIPSGAAPVFSLTVNVPPDAPDGSMLTSASSVASATPDPNGTNNADNTATTVMALADLSIGLAGVPNPVVAGTALTYAINVLNNGPGDAQTVAVAMTTPAGTTFNAVASPPGWNCIAPPLGGTGAVTCTLPTLAAGASASFSVTVDVLASVPEGSTIGGTATVGAVTADPNAANNTAMDVTGIGTAANLAVEVVVDPETVNAGELVTCTVTVTNLGPSDAIDLVATTPIPLGMAFESASADGGTCLVPDVGATSGSVICTWNGITPVGGTRTAIVTLRALPGLPDGSLVSVTTTVSSSNVDPDTTNNLAGGNVTVLQNADLSLAIVNVPNPVGPGSTLVSTITVTNNGPVAAASVVVETATPTGTVFASIESTQGTATTPVVGATGPIVISLGDMPNQSTAIITVAFLVTAADGASITSSVSLSTPTVDPDAENNVVSTQAAVANTALLSDLSTTITLDPPEVVTGSEAIITIDILNGGPDPAVDVVMVQTLPPGTVLRRVQTTQGTVTAPEPGSGGTVRVQLGTMVVGAEATVRITVQVNTPTGSTVLINAITSSASSDPDPFNNSSIEELGVREGEIVLLDWLPPNFEDPVPFPPPRSLTVTRFGVKSPLLSVPVSRPLVAASPREPRATLVGYNIYRSNHPGTATIPGNFFTQVPPGTTTVTVPTSPGGSFFVVTSQYDSGESDPTNEASGNIPAAELEKVNVKNTKIVADGVGFSDEVQVFVDGIPFVQAAKVKKQGTRVVQKGNLLTGQTVPQYIASRGGVVIVSFRNSNGGIATYRIGE